MSTAPDACASPNAAGAKTVGFIGAGTMGLPMARNLLRAGVPLVVWNRNAERCEPLRASGAKLAPSVDALFARVDTVLLSLLDDAAIDAVLQRDLPGFAPRLREKCVVNLGTTSAAYSAGLARDIEAAGGAYVEAPVSGSRLPAERGTLVGMVAGPPHALAAVRPLLDCLCKRVIDCGAVPAAMRTKLAINHFLIAMVAALGEAVHAARAAGVDPALLREALDAGPMASEVSRIKLDKLLRDDFSPQARIHDAGAIARLSLAQADAHGAAAPLLQQCVALYRAAEAAGWRDLDMIAATRTLAARA